MKQRLIFLGPPGAGKGTQAQKLCFNYNLSHFSTGDLLRAEVATGSSLGQEVAAVMNSGELVSDKLVLSIVETRLESNSDGWLLDGFPRNVPQAEALEALLQKICQPIEAVLLFELNDEILIERLLSRGRADDNEEVIRNRLKVYREQTAPLIDYYNAHGLLQSVPGDGEVADISLRIENCLG